MVWATLLWRVINTGRVVARAVAVRKIAVRALVTRRQCAHALVGFPGRPVWEPMRERGRNYQRETTTVTDRQGGREGGMSRRGVAWCGVADEGTVAAGRGDSCIDLPCYLSHMRIIHPLKQLLSFILFFIFIRQRIPSSENPPYKKHNIYR